MYFANENLSHNFIYKRETFLFLNVKNNKRTMHVPPPFSLSSLHAFAYICAKRRITNNKNKKIKIQNDYSTQSSQVVSNPSTNRARRGLTSLIGREVVLSSWYGRNHQSLLFPYVLFPSRKYKYKNCCCCCCCCCKKRGNWFWEIKHTHTHTHTHIKERLFFEMVNGE